MKVATRDAPVRRNPGGYTLLELMVVIVLMGIVTAAIVPEMKGTYEDALLRSASRELVDAFQLTYSRAVSLNQAHRIRLDTANGKYQIERAIPGKGSERDFAPVKDVSGCAGTLDSRITVRLRKPQPADEEGADSEPSSIAERLSPQDSIEFLPDGTAEAAEVLLRDRHGFGLGLRLSPVTARVSVVSLSKQ